MPELVEQAAIVAGFAGAAIAAAVRKKVRRGVESDADLTVDARVIKMPVLEVADS